MKRSDNQQTRRGTAAVEMALILPIFFAVILGIVEFGRAMMVAQLLTNGARLGARLAILDGKTNSDIEQYVQDFLKDSVGAGSESVNVTITIDPAPGNQDPGNEIANAKSGDVVNVRIQLPFDNVSYLPGNWLAGKNLVGQASMSHE